LRFLKSNGESVLGENYTCGTAGANPVTAYSNLKILKIALHKRELLIKTMITLHRGYLRKMRWPGSDVGG
jgi:hypothetical protein